MPECRWRHERRPEPRTRVGERLRRAYRSTVGEGRHSPVVAWGAFTVTFAVTRAITYSLHREGAGGSGGIVVAGRHLHHFNLGIALLAGVGAVAVRGDERYRRHPLGCAAYGSGMALIVDEFALLADLRDVYWANDGRKSVDAAVGLIGLGGLYLAGGEFWRAASRELRPRRYRSR